MAGLNRWVPRLTLAVAGLHAVTALAQYHGVYRDMLSAGIVGSVGGQHDREAATWFFLGAPAMAALGLVSRWGVNETGWIPPAVPPTLLGLGVLIAAVSPVSGGWVLIGLGVAGLAAGRHTSHQTMPGPGAYERLSGETGSSSCRAM